MPSWKVTNRASITNRPAWTVGGLGPSVGPGAWATRAIQVNANGQGPFRFRTFCINQLGNIGGGVRNSMFGSSSDGTNGCRNQVCVKPPYCNPIKEKSLATSQHILTIEQTCVPPSSPPLGSDVQATAGYGMMYPGYNLNNGIPTQSIGNLTNPIFNEFKILQANLTVSQAGACTSGSQFFSTAPTTPNSYATFNITFDSGIDAKDSLVASWQNDGLIDGKSTVQQFINKIKALNFSVEVMCNGKTASLSPNKEAVAPYASPWYTVWPSAGSNFPSTFGIQPWQEGQGTYVAQVSWIVLDIPPFGIPGPTYFLSDFYNIVSGIEQTNTGKPLTYTLKIKQNP